MPYWPNLESYLPPSPSVLLGSGRHRSLGANFFSRGEPHPGKSANERIRCLVPAFGGSG